MKNDIEKFPEDKNVRATAMRILIYKYMAQKEISVTLIDIENSFSKAERRIS